jgi:hypothetical protein
MRKCFGLNCWEKRISVFVTFSSDLINGVYKRKRKFVEGEGWRLRKMTSKGSKER